MTTCPICDQPVPTTRDDIHRCNPLDRTPAPPPTHVAPPAAAVPRTAALGLLLLSALLLAGAVLALLGGDDTTDAAIVGSSVAPTAPGPVTDLTTAESEGTAAAGGTVEAATTTSELGAVPTVAPGPNPYGDLPGTAPSGATAASAFAAGLQAGADPIATTVAHSDAFYYAWWSRLTGFVSAGGTATATETGYRLTTAVGEVEISGIDASAGTVSTFAIGPVGTPPVGIDAGVESSGTCPAAADCSPLLAAAPSLPDTSGSGAALYSLARVTIDPAALTFLLYVRLDGAAFATATFDGGAVHLDPSTGVLTISCPPAPVPGTVYTLTVGLADGRQLVFAVPVA